MVWLQLGQRLFDGAEQYVGVPIVKDEHRPQPDRHVSTPTHLHPILAHGRRKLVPRLGIVEIPGDEGSQPLATQVSDQVALALEHVVQARVESFSRLGRMRHEIMLLDDVDDLVGLHRSHRVTLSSRKRISGGVHQ